MYLPETATPLKNAREASFSLMVALYDLAKVYHANEDYKASEAMVKARDTLAIIEAVLKRHEKEQENLLYKELTDSGII